MWEVEQRLCSMSYNAVVLKYDNICQTQLIYSLIIIRLATRYDPTGSSWGLHYEPGDIKKLCTFLGSQTMFTTQLIYLLIIIRLAICLDPAGSSSGLHYEPVDIKKLRTFLGSQTMFTFFCKHCLGSQECTQLSNINWFVMKAWWWPRRVETCCQCNDN